MPWIFIFGYSFKSDKFTKEAIYDVFSGPELSFHPVTTEVVDFDHHLIYVNILVAFFSNRP